MSRQRSIQAIPNDRDVAITAIEHGTIVITVASRLRRTEPSRTQAPTAPFVTTIFGGPLSGQTWLGKTWRMMLRNHAGTVSEVTKSLQPT
jgi:hypothetical protein